MASAEFFYPQYKTNEIFNNKNKQVSQFKISIIANERSITVK